MRVDRIEESPAAWTSASLEAGREQVESLLAARHYPRQELVDILTTYNRSIGNDDVALMQARRLLEPRVPCVITGQQVGLMGGPLYTVLKAITCVQAARELGAVALFWAATDDHDVAEVNHCTTLDAMGNLDPLHLDFPGKGLSVETLRLTEAHSREIEAFCKRMEVPTGLLSFPLKDKRFGETMVGLMARLFAGTGLLFIEPRLLRELAKPFVVRELEQHQALQEALQSDTRALQQQGWPTPLEIGQGTSIFFIEEGGVRKRIRASDEDPRQLIVGGKATSLPEVVALVDREPERFSCGVAARPLLQSWLFPTLAYVAGPTERAYYRQLGSSHRVHGVPLPFLIPRLSATLISPYAAELLQRCGLQPWEPFPGSWEALLLDVKRKETLQQSWQRLVLEQMDPELKAGELAVADVSHAVEEGLSALLRRVVKAKLHRRNLPSHGLHYLENYLRPHGQPQERTFCWWEFQSKTKKNLLTELLSGTSWKKNDVYYLWYEAVSSSRDAV